MVVWGVGGDSTKMKSFRSTHCSRSLYTTLLSKSLRPLLSLTDLPGEGPLDGRADKTAQFSSSHL